MKKPSDQTKISRRGFIGSAAAAFATINFVPGHVLGLNGATSPNNKLNIAGIGVGGRGSNDIDEVSSENIIALCDADWRRASGTFDRFPKAKKYHDFRKMLDKEKDIDAVVVATPDHFHAVASMQAIKMGKHVYCEKPLTHDVYEARRIAEAARKHKVATQMGNQGQASEETRRLCEMVWDDAIGPVHEVHIWTDRPLRGVFGVYWPQGMERPSDTPSVPDGLDWDIWLGPAPERPYHPAYLPFKWRGWLDFGTGALGDIGCHVFDPVFRALKLNHPTSVQASSTHVNNESYPWASMVTYEFPARGELPPVKLTWYDGGLKPPRPKELENGRELGVGGRILVGEKGKILGTNIIPAAKMREYGNPPKMLPRSIGHHKEWIEAAKGGKPGGSNFDWAGPLTEVVLLGNIALQKELRELMYRNKLQWDGKNMKFTNITEANKFIRREYRQGWSL
ncbi:MAG: Gfo/Idh/MocA family oxidoreductase [Verrucomicrobia bacterium]|nr:Gfo/Idh/MocA family oxidoreductase [Verrucomicrobiota bacterium]